MQAELEAIRNQQKESWNRFSPGWKKWDAMTMDFLKPIGDEIIRLLYPKNGELILDVASGTGEPGLTIASMIKDGKVIISDLAEDMLRIAHENAMGRGILNIETRTCDVCELPFADNTFDAISCRFGFMFFPDMLMAAEEMFRVLKPGGRMAISVWCATEKNYWVTAIMSTISEKMSLPPALPGAPGINRCAGEGVMNNLFQRAGFKNISEKEVSAKLNCGTIDVYWNFMTEVIAPVVSALNKADDDMKSIIKKQVYTDVLQKFPDANIIFDANALVIYGVK